MNTVGRIDPLAFHFETGCIRARGKADKSNHNYSYGHNHNVKHQLRRRTLSTPSAVPAAAAPVADPSGGAGGQDARERGGGENLLLVRLYASRWLRMRTLLSPLPFYLPLTARFQSIGSALMAPAQTEPVKTATSLDKSIADLPAGTRVSYLAEGGANVVYKIFLPEAASPEVRCQFHGKLLRLRKHIDSSVPYVETIRNFDVYVRGLFDHNELVDQQLVRLPKNFIAACNDQLRLDEVAQRRPKSRHNVYLSAKEPFGLLITDMTPQPGSGACLWEFKPKWLLQSPSAPPDATRCRTCALRDMKNHDARKAGGRETRSFCPLDLISNDFEDVLRATSFIKGAHGRTRVARFLHRNPTLLKLQALQQKMNAVGLPGLQAPYQERALSMTLRDCTMYVKVPFDESAPLEARLGDLDFKPGVGGKLQYWRDLESRLIEEGWYSGIREGQGHNECALLRPQGVTVATFPCSTVIQNEYSHAQHNQKLNGISHQRHRSYPCQLHPTSYVSSRGIREQEQRLMNLAEHRQ
ncbi:hypothetical protein VTO42DRAFT_421 [Malbranchea cinnamomea]